jgi:hypothetical protein
MLCAEESSATSAAISRRISAAMALPSMICAIGVAPDILTLALVAETTTALRVGADRVTSCVLWVRSAGPVGLAAYVGLLGLQHKAFFSPFSPSGGRENPI